ncbi:UDP-N-acetylmuramoyl-L-alanyl-D-glutamate--2,6-diaminopimelate ligase [Paenibacillus allorhizosphaerae]|uniref:UDP-N-acetylmuramoyl-L-alanyl-D-glutamate--2,6-diaminopimelate ligase n=1 Tax=Paenibacillus allorhizosphaerae TaxID=2849866 RepID=A0ABN7TB60_9BACL|nr:UDP-N-acetylmuramoyl-L-alanyl-D-glutamate--2,6-diaminopimelate ligase [Paenibacillus allorhizosphaerae]CAG7617913.1 UDP-N-acetylmuramoyl-L-alanyl-D-glutamate--2, 6-diaminopimelate ligase [Paenibacillus allorhizosphaerae]
MNVKELASVVTFCGIRGDDTAEITGIQMDSRKIRPGDLFVCIRGRNFDGHQYADEAVANGAAALLVEHEQNVNIPQLVVKNARDAMAIIASHFYGYPSREMRVIGVTGTNGKTTSTYMIEQALRDAGFVTGVMGTIGIRINGEIVDPEQQFGGIQTTLESVDLQRYFRKMRAAGTEYCLMEVASIALQAGRVKGVDFRTALFTNLTQDHLDDHDTMEKYKAAKGLFFSRLGNTYGPEGHDVKYAVLNADDAASGEYAGVTAAQVVTYGVEKAADISASQLSVSPQGTRFHVTTPIGSIPVSMKLIGKFNVYNALGAIACCILEGLSLDQVKQSLERLDVIAGRMESVDAGQPFLVLVDYAHTPDGLDNALSAIREFAQGNVITVFGCGGDRDRTKRPIMGNVVAKHSDYIVITSDNPRSEDPEAIMDDIETGLREANFGSEQYERIADRAAAIQRAVQRAHPNDVVLIAGKGHETYQIVKGVTAHFDDRVIASDAIVHRLGT